MSSVIPTSSQVHQAGIIDQDEWEAHASVVLVLYHIKHMLLRSLTRFPVLNPSRIARSPQYLSFPRKINAIGRTMASTAQTSGDVKTHEVMDSSELKDGQQCVPNPH